jgi:hypothetical protein
MSTTDKAYYFDEYLLSRSLPSFDIHWKYIYMYHVDRVAKVSYIGLSVVYYIMTYRMVHKHQKSIEDYYSSLKNVSLNWVKALSVFFVLAVFSGITVHWFHRLQIINNEILSSIPFVFLGTFFAIVGNYGNRQRINIFPSERVDLDETENATIKKELNTEKNTVSKSNLTETNYELKQKLKNYFQEYRPFLNPELKIWDIAKDLNTNRTYISKLINGFLNYSSFVRSFKQHEDITPNEYRLSIQKSN